MYAFTTMNIDTSLEKGTWQCKNYGVRCYGKGRLSSSYYCVRHDACFNCCSCDGKDPTAIHAPAFVRTSAFVSAPAFMVPPPIAAAFAQERDVRHLRAALSESSCRLAEVDDALRRAKFTKSEEAWRVAEESRKRSERELFERARTESIASERAREDRVLAEKRAREDLVQAEKRAREDLARVRR